MSRLLRHLRGNAIAYLALFVALGGTSYAATSLTSIPRARVARAQSAPTADVRYWARVSVSGRLLAGSPGARVRDMGGQIGVSWTHRRLGANCMPFANVGGSGEFGVALIRRENGGPNQVYVVPLVTPGNNQFTPAAAPVNVIVVCPS